MPQFIRAAGYKIYFWSNESGEYRKKTCQGSSLQCNFIILNSLNFGKTILEM